MDEKQIRRINELAKKAKESGLTPEEKQEQAALRMAYVAAFRKDLEKTLQSTYVVDEDGNKKPVKKAENRLKQ
jgi:uncharacterized protein YnzC (UPF0291/DUF896 family)